MLRKSAWERLGGYRGDDDLVYGWEDWDLWLRLAADGGQAMLVTQILGRYRVSAVDDRAHQPGHRRRHRRDRKRYPTLHGGATCWRRRGLRRAELSSAVVEPLPLAGLRGRSERWRCRCWWPFARLGCVLLDLVALRHFDRELVEADAAETRDGAGEVLVDQLLAEADGLEHLRAASSDATVEMPIFDITLSTPLPAALM